MRGGVSSKGTWKEVANEERREGTIHEQEAETEGGNKTERKRGARLETKTARERRRKENKGMRIREQGKREELKRLHRGEKKILQRKKRKRKHTKNNKKTKTSGGERQGNKQENKK